MKYLLLLVVLLGLHEAGAQPRPVPVLSALPATGPQPPVTTSLRSGDPGVRYEYQLVHQEDNRWIWLAPAWRGQTKLELRRSLFNASATAELDALLMQTFNGLAAEGWELLESCVISQPTQAKHDIDTSLSFNDPQRPKYSGTTTLESATHLRYLFRRPLPR